jgi:hypothetical protein
MPDKQEEVPEVECSGCKRRVKCVRVSDGTVYRPFAWIFTDDSKPLVGLCGSCEATRGAVWA